MRRIGIVSLGTDLHAHAVAKSLREQFHCEAHVFCIDEAHERDNLSWGTSQKAILTNYDRHTCSIGELDVVWWRRANQSQISSSGLNDPDVHAFVSHEWKMAFQSVWVNSFKGVWVNDPRADMWASSKPVQLEAAAAAGLRVPQSLISNDPKLVKSFAKSVPSGLVVKKIAGAPGSSLATVEITLSDFRDEEISISPAVYQEKIAADFHYRVMAFGDNPVFIKLKSSELDWRRLLPDEATVVEVPGGLSAQIVSLIKYLGLRMGILDLIVTPDGEVVFLEVNTQGQFLFLQPLASIDLARCCAEFLSLAS